jgi:hypothetical protein
MKKGFKKYFIPNESNEHRPYFLREKSVLIILAITVFLLLASLIGSYVIRNSKFLAAIQSAFLVDLANEDRIAQGSSKLVINDKLVAAAQLKANDMAEKGYFAHTSPEGVTPWYWFGQAGYSYIYAGENLAVNFSDSVDVQKAWMNSPLHRANILNNRYKEIGIATAEGEYKGKKTTFIVQMFGTPSSGNIAPSNNSQPASTVVSNTPPTNPAIPSQALGESDVKKEAVKEVALENSSPASLPQEIFTETKNENYVEESEVAGATDPEEVVYTNWFERFLVNPSDTVDKAYVALFVLILFSLVLKIFVAIRKQHPKTIAYGILLLILVIIFMHINQEMFLKPVIAAF